MSRAPLRIGVLLSGSGTSLENLCERIDAGELPVRVAVVVSSREKALGLERARRRGIPALAVPRRAHPEVKEFNDALHAALEPFDLDLVLLLGFLSPFELRGRFEGRALNVHPALVPAFSGTGFYGARVQAVERRLVPEAVRLFAAGRLRIEGRRVRILPA